MKATFLAAVTLVAVLLTGVDFAAAGEKKDRAAADSQARSASPAPVMTMAPSTAPQPVRKVVRAAATRDSRWTSQDDTWSARAGDVAARSGERVTVRGAIETPVVEPPARKVVKRVAQPQRDGDDDRDQPRRTVVTRDRTPALAIHDSNYRKPAYSPAPFATVRPNFLPTPTYARDAYESASPGFSTGYSYRAYSDGSTSFHYSRTRPGYVYVSSRGQWHAPVCYPKPVVVCPPQPCGPYYPGGTSIRIGVVIRR